MKHKKAQIVIAILILALINSGCATGIGAFGGAALDSTRKEHTDYNLAALEFERPGNQLKIHLEDGRFYDCNLIDIKYADSLTYNNGIVEFADNHPEIKSLPKYGDTVSLKVSEEIITNWELIAIERNNIRVRRQGD